MTIEKLFGGGVTKEHFIVFTLLNTYLNKIVTYYAYFVVYTIYFCVL